jgi:DNA-binding protein YbaB
LRTDREIVGREGFEEVRYAHESSRRSAELDNGEARPEVAVAGSAEPVVTGLSSDGHIAIGMNIIGDAISVTIDPSVIDPSRPAELERRVLGALRDAVAKIDRVSRDRTAFLAQALRDLEPLTPRADPTTRQPRQS